MSGTLVVLHPNGTQARERFEGRGMPQDPKRLQELVQGYLEMVRVRWEGRVRKAFINEEGKLRGMPDNMPATKIMRGRMPGDQIVGPMVIWVPDPRKKKNERQSKI